MGYPCHKCGTVLPSKEMSTISGYYFCEKCYWEWISTPPKKDTIKYPQVVDYADLLVTTPDKNRSYEDTAKLADEVKALAMKHNIAIVMRFPMRSQEEKKHGNSA